MADISLRTLVLGLALSLSCHFVDCKGTLQISYASGRTPHAHHCDAREKNGNYSWFDQPIVAPFILHNLGYLLRINPSYHCK